MRWRSQTGSGAFPQPCGRMCCSFGGSATSLAPKQARSVLLALVQTCCSLAHAYATPPPLCSRTPGYTSFIDGPAWVDYFLLTEASARVNRQGCLRHGMLLGCTPVPEAPGRYGAISRVHRLMPAFWCRPPHCAADQEQRWLPVRCSSFLVICPA